MAELGSLSFESHHIWSDSLIAALKAFLGVEICRPQRNYIFEYYPVN